MRETAGQGKLDGRAAIVTGGSGAIGQAIARALAAEGAAVLVHFSGNQAGAEAVVAEIGARGGRAVAARADVTRREEAQGLVAKALDAFGGVDILVNNAGTTRDTLILRMRDEDWQQVVDVNLTGAFNCIRAALKEMVRHRRGRIINIASVVGQQGNAGQANYAAAKAGLIGLTKAVAREVSSRGINVNAVAPGFIQAGLTQRLPADIQARLMDVIPLRRPGTPEDVAAAVVFLASDDAGYMTGQVLNVDGGTVMR